MSNYGDLIGGLATVLRNGITGVHVYETPPDAVNEFPACIIIPEPMDPRMEIVDNSFLANFRVITLVAAGESSEAWAQLWDYLDPTLANKSVVKAIRTDPTLNGKADTSDVTRIENIGRREIGGGFPMGFDALVEAVKTVA